VAIDKRIREMPTLRPSLRSLREPPRDQFVDCLHDGIAAFYVELFPKVVSLSGIEPARLIN
jgi:hypothetical protein